MSEPLDDGTLDTLIDESARSLTAADAAPGLRARVFSRIQDDADRRWKPRWLVPGVALGGACVVAIGIYVGSGSSRSNGQIRLKPDPTAETSSIQLKPDPTAATVRNVGSDSSRSNNADMRSGFNRSSDSAAVQSEPPPGFEPIGTPGLTIDPLGVTGLATPAGMNVESIPVESIEIAALGTE